MMAKDQDDALQNLHLAIGQYYNIPVISYHNAIEPLIKTGAINWNDISTDGLHPNDLGHLITASLLFKHIRSSYLSLGSGHCSATPVPGYLFSDMYEFASIMKTTDTADVLLENHGWLITPVEYNRVDFTSSKSGKWLKFQTNWRELALLYVYNVQQNGLLEVIIDGQPIDTLSNSFAGGWGEFMNMGVLYKDNISKNHNIILRNLANEPFHIKYVLFIP
jgi:hypothetical protein